MKKEFNVLCFFAVICLASGNKASFITKCKWDDSKCIKDSTQAAIPIMAQGIPELGVEKMDPLVLKEVDASKPNLKLNFRNIKVHGLKDCLAQNMERDIAKSKIFVNILCTAKVVADYEMKGQLLVLPIEGKGEMRATLNDILIHAEADVEEKVGKDSKNHWNIKKWKHEYELKSKSTVEFDNLFGGNEVLGKGVKDLIATNGNEVIIDVGQELIKAVIGIVAKNCNNMFHAVPLEDLVIS